MKIKKCRNCQNSHLKYLFSLGKLSYTGKFPKNNKIFKNIFFKIIEGDITKKKIQEKIFLNNFSFLSCNTTLHELIVDV
jgi:dTDP-D-glucose 4,6-dehydratase